MHTNQKSIYFSSAGPQQTKIFKTVLIESLEDNFTEQYPVQIPYDSAARQLNMGQVLHEIFFQILNSHYRYQIFYFSNLNGCFCFGDVYPWTSKFVLGEEFIPDQKLFIAFRKICHLDEDHKQNETEVQQVNKKKRRINDRTILETLQKVSIWRQRCQQQKITFQEAAKQLDIPKKTLDDYYALIRAGQLYGFDFQKNYNQKIGVLRQFVKQKQQKNKVSQEDIKNIENDKSEFIKKEDKKQAGCQRKMSIIDRMMLEDSSDEEKD